MKTYELNDSDNESMGILQTDVAEETIIREWPIFYAESEDCGVDTFAEYLSDKYTGTTSNRFYVDGIIGL